MSNLTDAGIAFATATAAKSGTTVTATLNGTETTIQVARDLTVASGDALVVVKNGSQWVAIGRFHGAAPAPPANGTAPDPQPATVTGTLVVTPVETRSYNTAWRADTSVYQGNFGGYGNHVGAVFYGGNAAVLAGATVLSAAVHVRRLAGGNTGAPASTMRLMTEAFRPAGTPTLTSTTTGPSLAVGATVNDFPVPTVWAQSIVDGGAGGLAFYDADGSPYIKLAGKADWSVAFTLIINWQRG